MENLIDKTVLSTPKPCASSTVDRKEFLRKIDKKYGAGPAVDFDSVCEGTESNSSLAIIYDINQKDFPVFKTDDENTSACLQKQRQLAHNNLERSKIGLSSRFLIASNTPCSTINRPFTNNSTVNESDLLQSPARQLRASVTSDSFAPADVSTPKNSNASNQPSEQPSNNLSKMINEATKKIRNSDISLKDLCTELSSLSMGKLSLRSGMSNMDSGMFVPAELMEEKLLKDEMSWREKKDLPMQLNNISSILNTTDNNNFTERHSMGDFFKQRSENINNEFFKKSPEKGNPIPLVDLTNTMSTEDAKDDTEISSVMSATEIYKVLSEYGTQDAQQILNYLTNTKKRLSTQRKFNDSVSIEKESILSERDVDEFILASKCANARENANEIKGRTNLPHILRTSSTLIERDDQEKYLKYNKVSQNLRVPSSSPTYHAATQKENSPRTSLYMPNSPSEIKENISDSDRSLTSVRSGSSLDTLPEGKFPIKSNRLELIWGCLKSGRSSTQEFQIRNQLNQRIRMQASITGSSFRLIKDNYDSELLNATTFVLRPLETKSFSIMFCPTNIGAASEKINFYPIFGGEIQHSKRQVLTLFGYGGHVNCDISNITKDSGGKLWLSLGKIECQPFIEQKFVIKNTGTLFAFACIDIVLKGPFTYSNLKVDSREVVVKPQDEVNITVRYYPSKPDLTHLKNTDIVEIGCIKIITGAEIIRGRLRRLYAKLKQKDIPIDPLIERLSGVFPGENMPSDLHYLKESVSAVRDLLRQLTFREVAVTIEQDLESTLVNPIMDMNETTLYHTLYQGDEDVTEIGDMTAVKREKSRLFSIEPTNIILTFPMKREDTILLHSKNSKKMAFDVKVEPTDLFSVFPINGIVGPYETIVIKILCHPESRKTINNTGRVLVYVESEATEISVKAVFIKTK